MCTEKNAPAVIDGLTPWIVGKPKLCGCWRNIAMALIDPPTQAGRGRSIVNVAPSLLFPATAYLESFSAAQYQAQLQLHLHASAARSLNSAQLQIKMRCSDA